MTMVSIIALIVHFYFPFFVHLYIIIYNKIMLAILDGTYEFDEELKLEIVNAIEKY